jgi:endonuclease/exonuclease/phosphatase family metal-dependent hydrolase
VALAVCALVSTSTAIPALAATSPVSKVRVAEVTSSSFTVTVASLGSGWRYRLYASTNKADIYYNNLPKAPHRSTLSATPKVKVGGLAYTSTPYWYRVQGLKGTSHRTSDIFSVGLRPAKPGSFKATLAHGAVSLTWSGTSSAFSVQQAADAGFKTGLSSHLVSGGAHQLTAMGLTRGSSYWFRVRAVNTGTTSAYTGAVRATPTASGQRLRAMTFNILMLDNDGSRAPGAETIAPWSQRRLAAAGLISSAAPDVIGIQEGATWVGAPRGQRQVDSLVSALGGTYALAVTEIPPDQPHYFRTGTYVLYKPSVYAPLGAGGHWDLGEMPGGGNRFAAYQVLRHRSTGATFLFVTTHLYVGSGLSGDQERRKETVSLASQARAYAASHGDLPVVYTGDVNSDERHQLDGPAVAMDAAQTADTQFVAPSRTNAQYNSANQYHRIPPASGLVLDHLYASPGVGVTGWRQVLKLSGNRFSGVIPSDHNPVVADLVLPS